MPTLDAIPSVMQQQMEASNSLCTQHWHLFKLSWRDEHTIVSLFYRREGTNFSLKQRVACFFIYLITLTASSAMYYGQSRDFIGDITVSFYISITSTIPVLIIKLIFMFSKPKIQKSSYNSGGHIKENTTVWKDRLAEIGQKITRKLSNVAGGIQRNSVTVLFFLNCVFF